MLYILVVLILIFSYTSRKNLLIQSAWQHVAKRPFAMFALLILVFFSFIACLDSLHFHPALSIYNDKIIYSTRVQSLLDILISPLGQYAAKTYSAPFAIPIVTPPKYINLGILFSVIKTMIIWILLCCMTITGLAIKNKNKFSQQTKIIFLGKAHIAWRAVFFALLLIFMLVSIALYLAQYYYVFGTDKVGGDVFYQAIKSIRTGLLIGTLTTLLMLPFAIFFGTIAGYFSGWIDDSVQYIYTLISAIPGILLIAAAALSLQIFIKNHPGMFNSSAERADVRLLMLCVILGVTAWTDLCRLIRAETLKLRQSDFVQAALVMGVSRYKIILRHILPNVTHIILITVTLNFSMLVLAEAVLSYVGVGVDPTTMSWGNMINSARFELAREPVVWWPLLAAFVFMFILVFSANLFADALRDAFDPRVSDKL